MAETLRELVVALLPTMGQRLPEPGELAPDRGTVLLPCRDDECERLALYKGNFCLVSER